MAKTVSVAYRDVERIEVMVQRWARMIELTKVMMETTDSPHFKTRGKVKIPSFTSSNMLTALKGMKYTDSCFSRLVSDVVTTAATGNDLERIDMDFEQACEEVGFTKI